MCVSQDKSRDMDDSDRPSRDLTVHSPVDPLTELRAIIRLLHCARASPAAAEINYPVKVFAESRSQPAHDIEGRVRLQTNIHSKAKH